MIYQKKQYGTLWFKNVENDYIKNEEGIAVFNNKHILFKNVDELPKDFSWWSNLPLPAIFNMGRQKSIKNNNFFGFSLSNLVLMFCKKQDDLPEFLNLTNSIFEKLIRYYSDEKNEEREIDLSVHHFAEFLSSTKTSYPLEIQEISKKSFIDNYMVSQWEKGELIKLNFFFLPSILAEYLSTKHIPKGNFSLSKNQQHNYEAWLMEKDVLFIAKLSNIKMKDQSHNPVFNREENLVFQRQFKKQDWYTKNEVLFLKTIADFNIDSAYLADDKQKIKMVDNWGELSDYSFVYQMWCASHIHSIASPMYEINTRVKDKNSPVHSFIQSYLREICYQPILAFHSAGFKIYSYGYGKITIWATKNQLAQASTIANKYNLSSFSFMQQYLNNDFSIVDNSKSDFVSKQEALFKSFNYIYKNSLQKDFDNLLIPIKVNDVENMLKVSARKVLEIKSNIKDGEQKIFQEAVHSQLRTTVNYLKNKGSKKD